MALQKSLNVLIRRSSVVNFSNKIMPKNIEELNDCHIGIADLNRIKDNCTRTQEIAVSQSNRIFSSGFLSDQSTVECGDVFKLQDMGNVDDSSTNQHIDTRILAYDLSNINIEMKTNVPEPYKAEAMSQEVVEGLPSGLSDAKVNLEARSNMDCRLDLNLQQNDTYNMV